MAEPVQEHRAFDSSFFFHTSSSTIRCSADPSGAWVQWPWPHLAVTTERAVDSKLKVDVVVSVSYLLANLVLKLLMFSAWSGDRTVVCSFDCAIKRANRFKAVTGRHACARLSAHVFRMAGAKATKLCVYSRKARSIVLFFCFFLLSIVFFWSGIFDFRSWKGLEKVLNFLWKIRANPAYWMLVDRQMQSPRNFTGGFPSWPPTTYKFSTRRSFDHHGKGSGNFVQKKCFEKWKKSYLSLIWKWWKREMTARLPVTVSSVQTWFYM